MLQSLIFGNSQKLTNVGQEVAVGSKSSGRDIVEGIKLIFRKKWTVIFSIAVCTFASTLYILLTRPIWESSVVVKIGNIAGTNIETSSETIFRLTSTSLTPRLFTSIPASIEDKNLYQEKLQAKMVGQGDSFLEIRIQAYSPEKARNYLMKTVENLVVIHQKMMDAKVGLIQKEVKIYEGHLSNEKSILNYLERNVKTNPQNVINLVSYEYFRSQMQKTENEKIRIEKLLDPKQTFSTEIFSEIQALQSPVFPKKGRSLALGFIIGLFLGIFLVFAREQR